MMQNCKNYSISRKKKTYFCTNFFAMRFLYLDQVDSTNAYLLRFPEQERIGTVVWTHEQTAGKGMATNTWESTPGLNLTFSMGVDMAFQKASEQFLLSQAMALAVYDVVGSVLRRSGLSEELVGTVSVKWPNDLFFGNRKLCGILINSTIHGDDMGVSVVGIGLNVNQTQFHDWPTPPVSLKMILGHDLDLQPLLERIATAVNRRVAMMRMEERKSGIHYEYLNRLYRYRQWGDYEVNGETVRLLITGIDPFGRLMTIDEKMNNCVYDIKEIRFL